MNLKSLLRSGSAAAIAAVLSFGALPSIAHADDSGRRGHQARSGTDVDRTEARQARQERRAAQAPQAAPQQRTYAAPAQQQRTRQAPVAQQRSGRDWNQGDRRSDTGATRSGREWNRGDLGQTRAVVQAQAAAQARAEARSRTTAQTGSRDWGNRTQGTATGGNWERNRTYSDTSRNQTYRDGRQQTQNAYRDGNRTSGYRDGNRTSSYRDGNRTSTYRDGYRNGSYRDGDHRSWSRDWRRDNRYDWSNYRRTNRNVYHIGRYYAPYSNYRYNRLSIGFSLNSLFYGSRYWINDPWQYRLPEAYGPYRWVRYYDDALLVDIYSGQVVDVIYDFFW